MWLFIAVAFLIQASPSSEELIRRKRDVNPETFMNVSQMICCRGYPSEEYDVLTDDGYYVTINRIPCGRQNPCNKEPKPAVLLQHGIFGEGSNWVSNLANNSLGFILADSGYDVWIGNNRGTTWSKRHQNFSTDQEEFWDFSFHEMARYDLPAMINFILQKTGLKQIYYVGYSQGSTIGFIAFSSMPELAQKVKMFFALAPVVTIKNSKSPVLKMPLLPNATFQDMFGKKDFHLRNKNWKVITANICSNPLINKLCANFLFLLGGYNEKNLNTSRMDVYIGHYPDSTSTKNMMHWLQGQKSGEFRYFDYGERNQAHYHQMTPPHYMIEEMAVPTAAWSGGADWVADKQDVDELLPRISNLVCHNHVPHWNHWDFIWGLDAPKHVYCKMTELMRKRP
ncbi:putative lysosomal acid lipase/cholesteryl ester hydrolase [Alligator sinensis]|uniref:Lipase n=1 Tax=Alligator sinensis TaxID=38654 RepID=A0A1U7SBS8_ALLSI|nr:putative lysosomal acid lipase/cholesteryl ester hydrolase [Alligator sinensis]